MIWDPPSINESSAVEKLRQADVDLFVVCDYGQILRPDALSASRLGGINLHGSLLPAYRGAAPVQRALLAGDCETGVSVIHMTPQLDGGPILAIRRMKILDEETAGQLEERLSLLGVEPVLECLRILEHWDGESPLGKTQDAAKSSIAPRLSKQEAEVDWRRSNRQIDCHVRGMQPWPIAFAQIPVKADKPPLRLAILQVTAVDKEVHDLLPGQITGEKDLVVATGDGALRIDRVRPAGKREMSGEEFLRGYQLPRGTSFQAVANG